MNPVSRAIAICIRPYNSLLSTRTNCSEHITVVMCHNLREINVNNENILKEAQRCFFLAMLAGWAGDAEATPAVNKPGFKQTIYLEGDFCVLDEYGKGRGSNFSTGTTTIWYFDEPVWVMTYGGCYREDEIPFLKSVLVDAYRKGEFYNGRGYYWVESPNLIYSNMPRRDCTFLDFGGREEISTRANNIPLGHHWYHGMSLLIER